MEDNHVVEPQVMYRTVLLHIPYHVLERARGILSLADTWVDPFTQLKDRLVVEIWHFFCSPGNLVSC